MQEVLNFIKQYSTLINLATLIFIIIYVVKTWHIASATRISAEATKSMASEMKAARESETSPHVIVFFNVSITKAHVHLVVRNIGKGVAENVKVEFTPFLESTLLKELVRSSWAQDGFGTLPPGGEIRTFIDLTHNLFGNEEFSLKYVADVTFSCAGTGDLKKSQQTLDLRPYKNVDYIVEKGIDDVVGDIKLLAKHGDKTAKAMEKIAREVSSGVWVRNECQVLSQTPHDVASWQLAYCGKLMEFVGLWDTVYSGDKARSMNPSFNEIRRHLKDFYLHLNAIASSEFVYSEASNGLEVPGMMAGFHKLVFAEIGSWYELTGDDYNKIGDELSAKAKSICEKVLALRST